MSDLKLDRTKEDYFEIFKLGVETGANPLWVNTWAQEESRLRTEFEEIWKETKDLWPIDVINFSIRIKNILMRNKVTTIGQLREAIISGEIWNFKNIGLKTYEWIEDSLRRWDENNA